MEKYLYILKKCFLFKEIKDGDILKMLQCLGGRVAHYKKDKIIFFAGDPVTSIGVILSGYVQITNDDIYGNRTIISKMGQGSLFAEAFAYANIEKFPVTVIATEESDILMINFKHILNRCSSSCNFHNKLVENMLEIIAKKNVMLNQKLEILSKRSTREKLLAFFSVQVKLSKSNIFTIQFDRQELADYLCVDRSAMSNELGKMRDEGLIEFKKNNFTLISQ